MYTYTCGSTHTWPRPAVTRSVSLPRVYQAIAGPLWSGTCVARRRAADIHARVRVSSRLSLAPLPKEGESSSGAARARCMTASSAASPMQPNEPHTALLSTAVKAPEDVEHAVGRRCEAHPVAHGGAKSEGEQRRPGVGRRAEAVQVVAVACGERRGTHALAPSRTGAGAERRQAPCGRRSGDGSGAVSGVSDSAILHARGRPGQSAAAAGRG
jgi:hypothetical protein